MATTELIAALIGIFAFFGLVAYIQHQVRIGRLHKALNSKNVHDLFEIACGQTKSPKLAAIVAERILRQKLSRPDC